jgi:TIR domain
VLIGDRKNPNGPCLSYSPLEWGEFIRRIRCSDFDGIIWDAADTVLRDAPQGHRRDFTEFITRGKPKLAFNSAGALQQENVAKTSAKHGETPGRAAAERVRISSPPSVPAKPVTGGWDVFISYASEDKTTAARPLADALKELGITVWIDSFELKIGDSLRRKVDDGLARSRFGVVILSPAFFAKGWPRYELNGLVTRGVLGEQCILPVWHGVTRDDVIAASPSIADKIARSTAEFTIQEIAYEIAEVVSSQPSQGEPA